MNSSILPLKLCRTIASASGSRLINAFSIAFAWSNRMCGGSGGTSGSVMASMTVGRAVGFLAAGSVGRRLERADLETLDSQARRGFHLTFLLTLHDAKRHQSSPFSSSVARICNRHVAARAFAVLPTPSVAMAI